MSTATMTAPATATATKAKPRVFSGIQPSGALHLGNYLGAIKRWVAEQDQNDNSFCIVDLHAITVPQDAAALHEATRELAAVFFASGLDPDRVSVFVQSHVSAHAELAWILNCFTPMGWLERMTQFKDKAAREGTERASTGLFAYPALMAADILLYDTDLVPVGDDQKQHIELTRDVAERMNTRYGKDLFVLPRPHISTTGARIMSLAEPTRKMSKSEPEGSLELLAPTDVNRRKIMRAVTDSGREIRFDESRPGLFNLLEMYQLLSGQAREEIEQEFAGKGYGDLKKALAERVIETLRPIQERYNELRANPDHLEALIRRGADRIAPRAQATLKRVQTAVGLG
ncbi:MAG: Tryptophanyl-tRNA synthetase [uncultured Thermomicrobiales bacterium]|uniref:Tryptophan--tRNA ligase n=1 Tax=uncultured Thermomicrobiales bacterium TaxID=1645740 RepID=A0A6J4UQN8_9BACT|nr:MAG: Tryptophanyl-tRNA synthetase [uncultured Thermomicrobiales bacterium]